jgi:carbamoyltransferase
MSKQHTYVLGLDTYDHDVSACLLRDGAIAFAIAKERITREKHAAGFYKEVIDYCLDAEGIWRTPTARLRHRPLKMVW